MDALWSVLTIDNLSPLCHWSSLGCLDNCLFRLNYVMDALWSVLTIDNLSPLCHGYSLGCLDYCQFVSIMSWILIGVS